VTAKTSRDIPGLAPRKDKEAEAQKAVIQDAAQYDGKDRNLVHGDGGTLDMPVKPGDISKDD
jgi:hypothetical protein